MDFIEWQLGRWPEAKARYDALGSIRRRRMQLGDLTVGVQFNPARMVSTGAGIDKASLAKRPCFLCDENRPEEQEAAPVIQGWKMLLNPFPIFPVHLTFASERHRPQSALPAEIASIAEMLPGMTIFYNGSRAGASAPDHLHLQGVLTEELPLMKLVERSHPSARGGIMHIGEMGLDMPFSFVSAVITPDAAGMRTLVEILDVTGRDPETGLADPGLLNAYFWVDTAAGGLMRAVVVPRRAHRPGCYTAPEGERRVVSPGAVDMAGVIITPRLEDFEALTEDEIRRIYREVGV